MYTHDEENPEAPMTADELRQISNHNLYNTLEGFVQGAKDAKDAVRLSQLANALRMNRTPFRPNTPNYSTCWKALFNRAKELSANYNKRPGVRQPFY